MNVNVNKYVSIEDGRMNIFFGDIGKEINTFSYPLGEKLLDFLLLDTEMIKQKFVEIVKWHIDSSNKDNIISDKYWEYRKEKVKELDEINPYLHFFAMFLYEVIDSGKLGLERMRELILNTFPQIDITDFQKWKTLFSKSQNNMAFELMSELTNTIEENYLQYNAEQKQLLFEFYKFIADQLIKVYEITRDGMKVQLDFIYEKSDSKTMNELEPNQKLLVAHLYSKIRNSEIAPILDISFNSSMTVNKRNVALKFASGKEDIAKYVKENNIKVLEMFEINFIYDLLAFEFTRLVLNQTIVKKCENCKEYFLPEKRNDEIYCKRLIKGKDKTCSDIGAVLKFKESIEGLPIYQEYNKVYKRFYARLCRDNIVSSQFDEIMGRLAKLRDEYIKEGKILKEFKAVVQKEEGYFEKIKKEPKRTRKSRKK